MVRVWKVDHLGEDAQAIDVIDQGKGTCGRYCRVLVAHHNTHRRCMCGQEIRGGDCGVHLRMMLRGATGIGTRAIA